MLGTFRFEKSKSYSLFCGRPLSRDAFSIRFKNLGDDSEKTQSLVGLMNA